MASSGKGGTRWGALLSQAVAGVEARLDTMLAETEEANKQAAAAASASGAGAAAVTKPLLATQTSVKAGPTPSRSSSRATDRLQEKLARAVAAKNASISGSGATSAAASPRQSIDVPGRASGDNTRAAAAAVNTATAATASTPTPTSPPEPTSASAPDLLRVSIDSTKSSTEPAAPTAENRPLDAGPAESTEPLRPRQETNVTAETDSTAGGGVARVPDDDARDARIATLERELEEERRQHQDEMHLVQERTEALQAKLQYLVREAAEAAKKTMQAAPAGSLEKKLAEKELQVAQLLEEGQNLGVTEQKHRAILKKLRVRISEDDKALAALRTARAQAEAELAGLRARAQRVAELERAQDEAQQRMAQLQRETDSLRTQAVSQEATVAGLRARVAAAVTEAETAAAATASAQMQAQAATRTRELEEQVATLQLEKTLAVERAQAQVREWKEKAERAAERTRAVEQDAQAEVQAAERKLEALRMRAEETSSGALGDAQAKLLRQVETLQTQYAMASENWQGIEATLLARVAGLEKERDEALQRESEMRKKAREAALRAKRHEEDLEEARSRLAEAAGEGGAETRAEGGKTRAKETEKTRAEETEKTRAEETEKTRAEKTTTTTVAALHKRAEEAEAALREAKAELERQRAAWQEEKRELQLERRSGLGGIGDLNGRRAWLDDIPQGHPPPPLPPPRTSSRPESPHVPGPTRAWSSDFLGLSSSASNHNGSSSGQLRHPPSHDDAAERLSLRRVSGQRGGATSLGGGGAGSLAGPPPPPPPPPPPLLFSPVLTEAPSALSIHSTNASASASATDDGSGLAHDMVSVSTVAAGPSVQLVERMSAAIRRLESDKVAAREELSRLRHQRNEARAEVLALITDAEAGRAAAARVQQLEAEVADLQARYDTTLELLGEKSELVEELRADVEDVKAMYRDLVERTIQ